MGVRNGSDGRRGLWRSRWAAIGAAVAVTLGGGGLFVANAASSVPSSVVTITPERVLDTRSNLGLNGPFQRGVSRKLQITGNVATVNSANQVVVKQVVPPAGATGVLLNVTVVCLNRPGVSCRGGFVSVRPGDATGQAQTSSLNFTAGDIVPNSVQVGLPTTGANAGKIDIVHGPYAGSAQVDVIVDVVGYLAGGAGSDAALLARIEALEAAQPFAITDRSAGAIVTPGGVVVVDVIVTAPVAGQVTVNSTTNTFEGTGGQGVRCSITTGTSVDFNYLQQWASPGNTGYLSQLAGTRTFNIAASATGTYNLVCDHFGSPGSSEMLDSVLTAIFTPAP